MKVTSCILTGRALWLASLVLALGVWADRAAAQEARCNELGANCMCSEPLNTNSIPDAGGGWGNPSDSTVKECCTEGDCSRGHNTVWPTTGIAAVDASQISSRGYGEPLPSGSSVRWVQHSSGNGRKLFYGKHISPSSRRVCYRGYFMGDSANSITGACNNKIMQADNGNGQWILSQTPGSPTILIWLDGDWPIGGGNNNYGSGNLDWDDCRGKWCRMETCLSGGINNDNSSDPVRFEGYVVQVSNSSIRRDWNFSAGNPAGVGSTSGSAQGPQPIHHYMQDCANPGASYTHSMQAEWTTDSPGTFIGPAYEVENGTAPPPPPPPPAAQAPVAPQLLP